jgi:hypothetical protein
MSENQGKEVREMSGTRKPEDRFIRFNPDAMSRTINQTWDTIKRMDLFVEVQEGDVRMFKPLDKHMLEKAYPINWKPWCFRGLAPGNERRLVGNKEGECVGCPWMDDCEEEAI